MIHLFRDASQEKELELFIQHFLSGAARLRSSRALTGSEPSPPDASLDLCQGLSTRELEVLRLLASGASNKAIAEKLRISPSTVKNHAQNILSKLKVHSRLEAVALSLRYNLL